MAIWAVSLLTIDLSAYRLSAILTFIGIQSLIRFSKSFGPPSLSSALPPIITNNELPK